MSNSPEQGKVMAFLPPKTLAALQKLETIIERDGTHLATFEEFLVNEVLMSDGYCELKLFNRSEVTFMITAIRQLIYSIEINGVQPAHIALHEEGQV